MFNSISHIYNLCQYAKHMQFYIEPQFVPKCKKIIDSLIKENESMSLHTPMNTPLCIEINQGQFSWHLRSERTTCVSKERCLTVGRKILMESVAFSFEINVNY